MKVTVTTSWTKVIAERVRAALVIQNNSEVDVRISFSDPTGEALDFGLLLTGATETAPGGSFSLAALPNQPTKVNAAVWARAAEEAHLNYDEIV